MTKMVTGLHLPFLTPSVMMMDLAVVNGSGMFWLLSDGAADD